MHLNTKAQSDSESHDSDDSDKELQIAFQKGLLKGINRQVEAKPVKHIYNKIGLQESLSNFKSSLPWVERLDLVVKPAPPPKALKEELGEDPDELTSESINDDFKRENKFYRQAQAAILLGLPRLHNAGVPTKRPEDYFAEMVKSDLHMKKIKENLMSIEAGKERSEKAKKLREMKKFGKQVQREVLEKRSKEKRQLSEAVKKFQKGHTKNLDFLDKPKKKGMEQQEPGKKRQLKNKQFGFGGQKKRGKQNTKSSTDDFSISRKPSQKGSSTPKGSQKNRPGKRRRQKSGKGKH